MGNARVGNLEYRRFNLSSDLKLDSPINEYPLWGYTGKDYIFYANYSTLKENYSNTTMVFYWNDTNKSDYTYFTLENKNYFVSDINSPSRKCNHTWCASGNYSISAGLFNGRKSENNLQEHECSPWVSIKIVNNTKVEVQNIFMMDEKEGFEGNHSTNLYNRTNSCNDTYCGYVDNDYSFSIKINATCLQEEDNRTINETTTVVYWNYSSTPGSTSNSTKLVNKSDNSILGNKSENKIIEDKKVRVFNASNNASNVSDKDINGAKYITWNENFTHEWDEIGKNNISATTYHWDPLDGNEMYSEHNNKSILIIKDPKKFVFFSDVIKNFFNVEFLENSNKRIDKLEKDKLEKDKLRISLVAAGLIILLFTYTKKNDIPVKISLFGLKPFHLKSAYYFTGTFTFIAGIYLFFIESHLNLHDLGIYLVATGLIIFFFTYAKNNDILAKISLFGLKPFHLKSVYYFTGTFTFIVGIYLFFEESHLNLHDLGISLVTFGLIILLFTSTKKNDIPVKIPLFSLKPFYLKSVCFSTGILTFMAGMYLIFIESFLNLHNLGIYLVVAGLIIFFFTYTRNNVPVQILLFGRKPFYLRSVNSFTGTLTFITGMYLYFVFGRCPWDIPIVSSLDRLSNIYFGVLYYDYTTFSGIPCLSILLGLTDVLTLSLIIHLIAIPLYKGELKFEKLSRIKSSSASAQPQQSSYSIKETKHHDN